MAKILNKKERVYDFKLTNYAKYLLSVGKYNPFYYAFFDDNVIYDVKYRRGVPTGAGHMPDDRAADTRPPEAQNNVNVRVKEGTPYIESLTVFQDVNVGAQAITNKDLDAAALFANPELQKELRYAFDSVGFNYLEMLAAGETMADAFDEYAEREVVGSPLGPYVHVRKDALQRMFSQNFYAADVTPMRYVPEQSSFIYDNAIGDALLDSKFTDVAPAWKIVVLNGRITTSEPKYKVPTSNHLSSSIPQVNISVDYKKQIRHKDDPYRQTDQISPTSVRATYNRTPFFADDRFIRLAANDPIIYVDEVNTELLQENFDIEVFLVNSDKSLERKYFKNQDPQIVDGMMVRAVPPKKNEYQYAASAAESESERIGLSAGVDPTAVEYFFDVVTDSAADRDIVCKQLQIYNKTSYYIDLDLECDNLGTPEVYNDIYGSEVQPEICLD
tara:strand:- start:6550 stop:7881 length:1332 start_codon:yes stop_codon:yes gene_type:complete